MRGRREEKERRQRRGREKRENIAGIPICLNFLLNNVGEPVTLWKEPF